MGVSRAHGPLEFNQAAPSCNHFLNITSFHLSGSKLQRVLPWPRPHQTSSLVIIGPVDFFVMLFVKCRWACSVLRLSVRLHPLLLPLVWKDQEATWLKTWIPGHIVNVGVSNHTMSQITQLPSTSCKTQMTKVSGKNEVWMNLCSSGCHSWPTGAERWTRTPGRK